MRIFHLITHLRLGAGRALVDLAVCQAKSQGHEVLVATAEDAEGTWRSDAALIEELERVGVISAPVGDFFHRRPAGLVDSASRLRTLVGVWNPSTVVHAHTALGAALGHWAGAPRVVVTCHGWDLSRPVEYDLQDALAFSLADAVISPSTYWAQRVAALPGKLEVQVVPYGFDLQRYPVLPNHARRGPLRIVCVGELTPRKGQDTLIDAMPLVWRYAPDAELHLLGEGDMGKTLRDRARHLDPDGRRIVFRGHVAHPYFELASYDLFCRPSRSDNQPVAIVEAMLAGLPIIATSVGGIPEMIEGSGSGEIVSPDSVGELSEAIRRLAIREDRSAFGSRGRAFARTAYDVEVEVDRIDALYRGAIEAAKGPGPR